MTSAVVAAPQRARRARYLIPLGTPRRREVLAALAVLGVLVGLLFAPVTLGLAVVFHAIGKITRWRPVWLAVPAACGVVWVLAIGPAAALGGFLAAPRAVMALLAGVATDPARLAHLGTASTGSVRWFRGSSRSPSSWPRGWRPWPGGWTGCTPTSGAFPPPAPGSSACADGG